MFQFILKNNYFTFKDQLFTETRNCYGYKNGPLLCQYFYGLFRTIILLILPDDKKPFLWKRLIDNVFLIWTHGIKSRLEFTKLLNSCHPTTKLEISYSNQNPICTYNLLTVYPYYIINPAILNPVRGGLVYSQMMRYRRIIADDQIFKRAHRLRVILPGSGYRDAGILLAMGRAYSFTQSQILDPKIDTNSPILPFATPFDHNLPLLSSLLRQHWSYIENDQYLSQIFQSPPVVSFQAPTDGCNLPSSTYLYQTSMSVIFSTLHHEKICMIDKLLQEIDVVFQRIPVYSVVISCQSCPPTATRLLYDAILETLT